MKLLQQSGKHVGSRWANDHDRASRQDLNHLRREMHTGMEGLRSEVRGELNGLRTEVKSEINELRTEVKSEINELRAEVKSEINELRAEVKSEINELRAEVKSDINELRTEVKSEISQLRTEVRADFKAVNDGMNGLRELVAGLAGKVDGLGRSVGLLTKLVMLLMAAAIAAGGWNLVRNSSERSARQPMLAMVEAPEDVDAE